MSETERIEKLEQRADRIELAIAEQTMWTRGEWRGGKAEASAAGRIRLEQQAAEREAADRETARRAELQARVEAEMAAESEVTA